MHPAQSIYPHQQQVAPLSQKNQNPAVMNGNFPQQTVMDNAQKR